MRKFHSFFAEWRLEDVVFLNTLKGLSKTVEVGASLFYVEEGEIYHQIVEHYSKKGNMFNKVKPKDFSAEFIGVDFSEEELEAAKEYTLPLGVGKLEDFWPDSTSWKSEIYDNVCETCGQPLGEQTRPWVLKRDFKQLEKHPFVGFEGLGGFVFCGRELADQINKEFGIGQMEVLIGKKQRVSGHLGQLDIPWLLVHFL